MRKATKTQAKKMQPGKRRGVSSVRTTKESPILKAVHQAAQDLHSIGVINRTTMHEFDALCLPNVPHYTPKQIKHIRVRCNASQAVFAKYINVTQSSLQKWEVGAKKPSSVAMKLLNIVDRNGLDALL